MLHSALRTAQHGALRLALVGRHIAEHRTRVPCRCAPRLGSGPMSRLGDDAGLLGSARLRDKPTCRAEVRTRSQRNASVGLQVVRLSRGPAYLDGAVWLAGRGHHASLFTPRSPRSRVVHFYPTAVAMRCAGRAVLRRGRWRGVAAVAALRALGHVGAALPRLYRHLVVVVRVPLLRAGASWRRCSGRLARNLATAACCCGRGGPRCATRGPRAEWGGARDVTGGRGGRRPGHLGAIRPHALGPDRGPTPPRRRESH